MDELTEPNRPSLVSLLSIGVTVFFCVYGGYLVLICASVGVPRVEPFDLLEAEIPAITAVVMDQPFVIWPIAYFVVGGWLSWQSFRRSESRWLYVFNLLLASGTLLVLYAVYLAIAVLPGSKLIKSLAVLP